MSLARRIQLGSLAVFLGGIGAFWGIASLIYGYYLLGALCLTGGAFSASIFGLQLRSFVLLKPLALVMRTPMQTVELPLQQVVSAHASRNALVVLASDGRRIPVPGTTWSAYGAQSRTIKVPYRSSDIANAINDAVKAAMPEEVE